ncbi:MAG: acyl-CoA dehydrogenase family protein [Pseudomonadota bacterium]|jgi:alkylation response protein AidB-like acyl-CoA dehydrogenase
MDLSISPEMEAFRAEVREFIKQNLPEEIVDHGALGFSASRDNSKRWQKILHAKGWVAPNWPKKYGGAEWNETQRFIFSQELARAGAPRLLPFGLQMVGPVIYTFGNEAQKQQHLPGILSGGTLWCQGYSEPGAGSDLANVRTAAVREGDDYIVNGQKIWTSYAHEADWIFCLVRTSATGKPQEGISFLLIDMKTPGIEVKPIISIDGLHHLNETFFTDVRVPAANRIGEEGKGWTYAKYLLQHERTAIAGVTGARLSLERLRETAAQEMADGGPMLQDADFARKLSALEIKLTALEYSELRALAAEAAGSPMGAETSMLKITGTEVQQGLQELAMELAGYYAAPYLAQETAAAGSNQPGGMDWAAPVSSRYLFGRAATIYGGTNEIQRGVIAKAVLGL